MNITHESLNRFSKEKTEKFGDQEHPLLHACGTKIGIHTQTRTIWDDGVEGSRHGELIEVGELFCPKCDLIPQTAKGAPIAPNDFFDYEVPIKHVKHAA